MTGLVTGCDRADVNRFVSHMVYVIARLEEAGGTMLAMAATGYSTAMRVSSLEVVDEWWLYPPERTSVPKLRPDSAAITRMDQALSWIRFIPVEQRAERRVVGARAMVNPLNGRHLVSWRALGRELGVEHHTVQTWHSRGIERIAVRLTADGFIFPD